MPDVALNHQNILEINSAPNAENPVWLRISKGFSNLSQTVNELIYQASYLSDGGWGSSTVTGGQYVLKLSGTRIYGDPAQDYIFAPERVFEWGSARETQLRVSRAGSGSVIWDVTLAKITDGGGDANSVSGVSVEIHGNGRPKTEGQNV